MPVTAVAVTESCCLKPDQLYIFVQNRTSFQLTDLLVNKALLSFALALCSCFCKGVACDKPKEGAVMKSRRRYVNENEAI